MLDKERVSYIIPQDEGGVSMPEVKGYCVKCKKKTEMKDPKAVTLKN